jgi:hypothetical protein
MGKTLFLSNAERVSIHLFSPEHLKFLIVNPIFFILQARSAWRPQQNGYLAQMRPWIKELPRTSAKIIRALRKISNFLKWDGFKIYS